MSSNVNISFDEHRKQLCLDFFKQKHLSFYPNYPDWAPDGIIPKKVRDDFRRLEHKNICQFGYSKHGTTPFRVNDLEMSFVTSLPSGYEGKIQIAEIKEVPHYYCEVPNTVLVKYTDGTFYSGSMYWKLLHRYKYAQALNHRNIIRVYNVITDNHDPIAVSHPFSEKDRDIAYYSNYRTANITGYIEEKLKYKENRFIQFYHEFGAKDQVDHVYFWVPRLYILMEYLEGESLSLDEGTKLYQLHHEVKAQDVASFQKRCMSIICSVADALEYIHKLGLIHSDVALRNILYGNEGKIKLCDFGALRHSEPNQQYDCIGSQFIGRGVYMAPELDNDAIAIEASADVYSFGICCYKIITGHDVKKRDDISLERLKASCWHDKLFETVSNMLSGKNERNTMFNIRQYFYHVLWGRR